MTVIIGILLASVIIGVVMWLLITRALREKYAVLWLAIGVLVLILGLFPGLLATVARWLGVALPSNLIFGLAILLLLGVALHLSWELSRAEDEIRRVAEESALLRADLEAVQQRLAVLEADASSDDAPGQPTT
ncbi:DUF2304 domain-containing protein [Microbacterium sp. zg.Y1090]|uniref:DUF2304 domain-containing protein n=1 Tax=Microbacterium TaxID=33882 RepID=UPI00214CFBAC|nr:MULTISPECIES: DUF2304 domain-containing protein [unclassified Microbacterium]MCR2813599.1 DUF2304 domain-containing protein [Microbacterium sp. zg.Y1084]MCR2818069.1 DUF2304 domain-containing protein [Microbacterium sp. zg.Y1090]WIM27773.1 DUF2304 domain-containing protein [Microbacterium sp. zg-Y1090]